MRHPPKVSHATVPDGLKKIIDDLEIAGEELLDHLIRRAIQEQRKVRKVNYLEYINSQEWKTKAMEAKEEAGWRCQACNQSGNAHSLHAHHRTYENLGDEQPGDITVLCQDCHAKFHDKVI